MRDNASIVKRRNCRNASMLRKQLNTKLCFWDNIDGFIFLSYKMFFYFQSMYGSFSAIEGCPAFQDALNDNPAIGNWYYKMKTNTTNSNGTKL